eukprot:Gb_13557 [translate_table: standard]
MVYAMAAMLACPLASFPNRVFHSGYRLPSFLPTFAPQLTTANCITLPRCSRQTSSEPANIFIRAPSDFNCSTKPKPKLSSSKSIFVETHRILGFGVCTAMLVTLAFAGESYAGGIESQYETVKTLIAQEPKNALSLPTWAIHVSSVVEWVVAMALVWQYGDKPGYQAWKGLSWGMDLILVPCNLENGEFQTWRGLRMRFSSDEAKHEKLRAMHES